MAHPDTHAAPGTHAADPRIQEAQPAGDAVIERAVLPSSGPWPTIDPFLFCVHHHDAYPRGNGRLGPDADLSGRAIGNDFSVTDGWSMYHGSRIPGFPQHPHRGFETVTFVRQGFVDHSDSMGATARYGRGDVQWLTAGGGIVHAEMFPLTRTDAENPTELFQIWVNLPASSKMATPHFSMFWSEDVPAIEVESPGAADGDPAPVTTVTVVAGEYEGILPQPRHRTHGRPIPSGTSPSGSGSWSPVRAGTSLSPVAPPARVPAIATPTPMASSRRSARCTYRTHLDQVSRSTASPYSRERWRSSHVTGSYR